MYSVMSKIVHQAKIKIAQLYKDMVVQVTEVWLQHNPSNHPVLCTTSAIANDNNATIIHY